MLLSAVLATECVYPLSHTLLHSSDALRDAREAAEMITSEMQPSRQLSAATSAAAYTEG